ncbi:HIT domain-containing protein [Planctomicrobium sp. SH668]|uniref:HIT domain-containing protein n=1 Tax=Planctomicrobium sp. SH668 TaxID=3448126 RepID=UPI003F5B1705
MIHPQLLADCHVLFETKLNSVLLNRNGSVPWIILVPKTETSDLLDLPAAERESVVAEAAVVAAFIREHWNLKKINFAQLGNVVPQMHIHIIGRTPEDACWPKPIWGNLTDSRPYSEREIQAIRTGLQREMNSSTPQ